LRQPARPLWSSCVNVEAQEQLDAMAREIEQMRRAAFGDLE
jgi:hypothetical protein